MLHQHVMELNMGNILIQIPRGTTRHRGDLAATIHMSHCS